MGVLNVKYLSGDFRVTHQAPANRWSLFSRMVSFVAKILFYERFYFCDGRTDTMCKNNDHIFGPGLVGQIFVGRYVG